MYPYRLRLRGPWECEPLERFGSQSPLPPPCRVTMPARWQQTVIGPFAGRVRCRRRFGIPARIDAHERAWLVFEGVDKKADVWLNGVLLGRHEGAAEPFDFEVTSLLKPRNEMVVEIASSTEGGGLWGDVALEMRCTAYLRNVQIEKVRDQSNFRLRVMGMVVGTCERPLDLYVLWENRTVHYTTIVAAPAGTHFDVLIEEPVAVSGTLRVELVNGATVWYVWEQTFLH